jgi:hypothetical protein
MRAVTADSWRWLVELGAVSGVIGFVALFLMPESPRWLAARANRTGFKPATPIRELFGPDLIRLTIIGILLGAIPLIGAWGASKWMIPWADKIGGTANADYKALTQGWWAFGAILGSFFGSHLAHLLATTFRQMDVVARLGGEEFVVLLPSTNVQDAMAIAERLRHVVSASPVDTEGEHISYTLSGGVACMEADLAGLDALISRADRALYCAKEAGRNRIQGWSA